MSDDRDIAFAAVAFGFGIWSFFWGFKRLRRKRMVENVPTSTVRSLAMGMVELIGKGKKFKPLKSPLTETECIFYKYTVERYERRGKHSSWVTVAKGDSTFCPFWLNDDTGRVMVLPKGAEFILPVDYQFTSGFQRPLSHNLITFMDKHGIRYKALLGNYSMRFKEWYICPDEKVYILGTARKTHGADDHKKNLMERLGQLKNNKVKMAEVDLNKDGNISAQEWDLAVAKVEENLLEEELKNSRPDELADIVITKGDTEKLFMISDHGQKELTKRLSWQAFSGVFGGGVLTIVMLWYLLFRLNIF